MDKDHIMPLLSEFSVSVFIQCVFVNCVRVKSINSGCHDPTTYRGLSTCGFLFLLRTNMIETCLQPAGRFGTHPLPTQGVGGVKCSGPLS